MWTYSMEENDQNHREVEQHQESGDESNRGILLQAPGNHQPHHRVTNFFIDNILRPEFGRRKEAHHDELYLGRDIVARSGTEPSQHRGSATEGEGASKAITVTQDKKNEVAMEGARKPRALSGDHSMSSDSDSSQASSTTKSKQPMLWPAWVYCTRYSDRPSSGKTHWASHRAHNFGGAHPMCLGGFFLRTYHLELLKGWELGGEKNHSA